MGLLLLGIALLVGSVAPRPADAQVPQEVITTNAQRAESVYVADLDGDGDEDVLSASEDDDKIAWYENKLSEDGSIAGQQVITTNADRVRSVYATDLDGDGDTDVLSRGDQLAWHENKLDEDGSFGNRQVIDTGLGVVKALHPTDLDGDGDTDVLSASSGDDKIAWSENRLDEDGGFGNEQVITANTNGAGSVYAADLDGDGTQDVLSASYSDDKIAWYENSPPTITNVSLGDDGANNLTFHFESDRKLRSQPTNLAVSVDGPSTSDVYTFDRTDFDESGSGPYTYSLSASLPYDDGSGIYTASVDQAIGSFARDGAEGAQTDSQKPLAFLRFNPIQTRGEVQPDGQEAVDVTLSIENTAEVGDTTGVAVDVTVPSGVTVHSSSATDGSYSSGTWDGIDLPPEAADTLTLSVSLTERAVRTLTAVLSGDGGVTAETFPIIPAPYGSGQALTLDGSGDFVSVPNDEALSPGDGYEKHTIELWFRAEDVDVSEEQVLYEEGNSSRGFSVYLKDGSLYAGAWEAFHWENGTWLSTSTVESGTWHHVALVFDEPNGRLEGFLDGEQFEEAVPYRDLLEPTNISIGIGAAYQGTKVETGDVSGTGRYFAGQIDQVRLWRAGLSAEQVRARAHRTFDLGGPSVESLLLAYRFNAESGGTVFDIAGSEGEFLDGSFQGDPQWTAVSGARLGQQSASVADGESTTLSPSGGTVTAENVSTSDGESLQVYQYGRTDGPAVAVGDDGEDFSQIEDNVTKRLHTVWGVEAAGDVSADVTIDYSEVQGLSAPENVRLLKREGPGAPWQDVSGNWTWDEEARTFSTTGLSSFSQYAVGEASTALPVELTGLEGRMIEDGVRLTWTTAGEENNAGFEIQRRMVGDGSPSVKPSQRDGSSSNEAWQTLGHRDGAGTTAEPQTYRFTDRNLPYTADSVSYRLKQVDLDGSEHLSEEIVVERAAVETLRLRGTFPNPARRRATVQFAVPEGTDPETAEMQLYDVLGRRVQSAAYRPRRSRAVTNSIWTFLGSAAGSTFCGCTPGRPLRRKS